MTSRLEAELWRDLLTDNGVLSGETKAESLLMLLASVTIEVGVSIAILFRVKLIDQNKNSNWKLILIRKSYHMSGIMS